VSRQPYLTIDLDAIASNYKLLRDCAKVSYCAAVVKANAYGLGAERVTNALLDIGCKVFFVAQLSEAVPIIDRIRSAGGRLFVLNGLEPESLLDFVSLGARPVLNSLRTVEYWLSAAPSAPFAVHLDTGFSRLGLDQKEDRAVVRTLSAGSAANLELVLSHLACADTPSHEKNQQQLEAFQNRSPRFRAAQSSLANSAGIFLSEAYHFDLVRPGLALYGGQPIRDRTIDVRPAFVWRAPLLQIRRLKKGDSVGYGANTIAQHEMAIAVVGAGYADGLPVAVTNCGTVCINGATFPIFGRVSMDSFTVNVSACDNPEALVGAWVELIGPGNSLESQSARTGQLSYELMVRISDRSHRIYAKAS
jgi:alanine racemase